ncbi:set domain-containing protein [Ophiostoma piceae UAMH 11346]|uniref:Set domain-containing protein n=1 Tax=Ophiostoma piceae (strain UAMH 11346) TaxID=1262450 RepID=S3CE24_OPHP1|nr:set domain-containing protein [Ophiostoma piceae UAMH 11346]
MALDVKEESLPEIGVSSLPDFAKTRQSAQPAPGSTDSEAMPRSAIAATATATILSDGMPATPYSLQSLPATPPFETIEFDADKGISATVGTATEASPARPVAQLMNETPSDSASEPQSEQARPEQPATRMYRFRPEFMPARRSPPGQRRDDTDSPEPLPRRASSSRRKSARKSLTEDSLTSLAPLSPSTAEDASEPTGTIATPSQQTPVPADSATSSETTPSAADTSIAARRPMRTVRQAKPIVQDSPRQIRPGAQSVSKADINSTSPASLSAKKTSARSETLLALPQTVERRNTRRSGLPLELAPPKPASSSKRRRSESDKNLTGVSRELLRLEDTKEYKHVDENPVVYTVWSNGKYVPANAAGEPLPDKTKRTRSAKDADNSKSEAGGTASAQEGLAEEEAALDASRPVQKRLKKWMAKGLYSGQSMPKSYTSGLTTAEKKSLAKLPELAKEYPPNKTLPMPIYNGLRMLLQGRDFQLPFDVFNPLPPGQPKPVKYGKINKNRFVGEAHSIWKKSPNYDDSLTKCVCKLETGCDEDCQNRIMLYECNDMICNVGAEHCSNREFQRLAERTASKNAYNIGVEVFKTPNRGHGIRASRGFRPGQIIMEYIGEIITEEESDRRMNELYKDNECYYLMSFDQSLIIDGTSGSVARFVNHSCNPNCRMIKWLVSGQPRIALFAGDRTIQTGEELTYDYNFDPYSSKNVQGCLCGSENCRGILGPRKSEKSVSKAAAAAEKAAAADKSKSGSAAAQKKAANGSSKRKHDVYSMDDEDEDSKGAPAAKKMRTAPGQQQNSQVTKRVSKTPAPKAIMTTKAALEALAADAAKKARLEKASKAAKAARAAKAAKAAEELKAAEAKKAKAAKAAKAARASPSKSKSAAASKTAKSAKVPARGTKATVTKSSKPIKVVKAVQSVKVVKTARGLKASKTSTETKAAKSKTTAKTKAPARKTGSTTEKTAKAENTDNTEKTTRTKPTVKFVKPLPAKSTKSQKPKTSLVQRAETPPNAAATSENDTTPQATPMAQAVAKATKEAAAAKGKSPAKAHKSVKFVKKARSQAQTKLAKANGSLAAVTDESSGKPAAARRRQVPKKVVDITQAAVVKKTGAPSMDFAQLSSLSAASTPSDITDEEEELAAQLYLEVASSKIALKAKSRASASKSRAGRIVKPTAPARSARRVLGRPRRASSAHGEDVSEEIEEVSMFDDDRMLLDESASVSVGRSDSAEDTIHVAARSGRQN